MASICEPHRTFIEAQLRLKRYYMAIYQDLVDKHGFASDSVPILRTDPVRRDPNTRFHFEQIPLSIKDIGRRYPREFTCIQ